MKKLILVFVVIFPFYLTAQKGAKDIEQFVNKIDKRIPQLLNDFIVPGAAIAIIENGEVILQKGYGYSNIDKEIQVNKTTGFNIGSISKTLAAWGVMKLVEEGKIDLDEPAEKYLTRWHLPKSKFDSNKVTIRRLLSHTAGLSLHGYPGWSPNDKLPTIEESLNGKNNGPGSVKIIMEPGKKWKYSGGGYTILQLVIEEVTGQKFEDYMQVEILNPLGMINSSYKIDDKILNSSSQEHYFGEVIDFELFTAKAAAGLHTTIEDFTIFAKASLYKSKNHKKYQHILSSVTVEKMMKPVSESKGIYGLGYSVQYMSESSIYLIGHGGANTGWRALFMVNPITNDGFIMFTNSGAGEYVYSQIFCDWLYWKKGESLLSNCIRVPLIVNKIKQIIDVEGVDNINKVYFELKKNQSDKYDFREEHLNELGYFYLGIDEIKKALAVFKLNIDAFPNSFNVYNSYGEALLKAGNKDKAIENYNKSLELNPKNNNAIEILKKLGA